MSIISLLLLLLLLLLLSQSLDSLSLNPLYSSLLKKSSSSSSSFNRLREEQRTQKKVTVASPALFLSLSLSMRNIRLWREKRERLKLYTIKVSRIDPKTQSKHTPPFFHETLNKNHPHVLFLSFSLSFSLSLHYSFASTSRRPLVKEEEEEEEEMFNAFYKTFMVRVRSRFFFLRVARFRVFARVVVFSLLLLLLLLLLLSFVFFLSFFIVNVCPDDE